MPACKRHRALFLIIIFEHKCKCKSNSNKYRSNLIVFTKFPKYRSGRKFCWSIREGGTTKICDVYSLWSSDLGGHCRLLSETPRISVSKGFIEYHYIFTNVHTVNLVTKCLRYIFYNLQWHPLFVFNRNEYHYIFNKCK